MNIVQQSGWRKTDPGGGSDLRALDRFEDEGGRGPEDTRDQRRAVPPSAAPVGDVADPGRVSVTPGSMAGTFQVHHGDIPELHAEGATPREAAVNLAQNLAREIEDMADHYHRGLFGRILADVRAFVERKP
ncbi:hypothetical protein [Singulisphaera sp. PoT]|uniref:hypothetical protein n=1 Tax=Singulisphaera sp. PoT TaxID=3411797 RepID=UPI003BF52F0D